MIKKVGFKYLFEINDTWFDTLYLYTFVSVSKYFLGPLYVLDSPVFLFVEQGKDTHRGVFMFKAVPYGFKT